MSDGGNVLPRITKAEHIGPDDTGDNIEAKRVALYQWDGSTWQRFTGTVTANPTQPSTPTVTTVGDTVTSTQLIAANTSRKEVEFYNGSTAILYLLKGTGTASATNYTVQLNQGDYYSSDVTSAFQGVWASDAGGSVLITEAV